MTGSGYALPPEIAEIDDACFRGDTVVFEITVARQGALADLSEGQWWCTGKWWRNAVDDTEALFQVTQLGSDQGVITNPSPGVLRVQLTPAASAVLPPLDSPVQIDVQWREPTGEVWTVASGTLTFRADVTRSS
ncbi:MAG TPA: hypothetical protein VGJ60_07700 [Chloroflexota bacterium]|jgi:hypothetical protein